MQKWENASPQERVKLKEKDRKKAVTEKQKPTAEKKTVVTSPPAETRSGLQNSVITFATADTSTREALKATRNDSLHSKLDILIEEFRNFKVTSKKSTDTTNTPLSAIDGNCTKEISKLLLQWPDFRNILDLVSGCSHLRFFAGDEEQGVISVLRCETCYRYLANRKAGFSHAANPEVIAKKGLGG